MKLFLRVVLLFAAVTPVACSTQVPSESLRPAPNLITSEQMRSAHQGNALEVVETLRPNWLQTRGTDSFDPRARTLVQVYVDGVRIGNPELLRQITTLTVNTIRYLNGQQASQRFGLDHGSGAILVTTHYGPGA